MDIIIIIIIINIVVRWWWWYGVWQIEEHTEDERSRLHQNVYMCMPNYIVILHN
jgi:hypothetical protein